MRILHCFTLLLALCGIAAAQAQTISPGDRLLLTCQEEATLNREYGVTRDGLILLDFVGAVEVAGLTEEQAAQKIEKRLIDERILRTATVTVEIIDRNLEPVHFLGAVKAEGAVPYKEGLRLSDVIAAAKPAEGADLTKVQIRTAAGGSTVVDSTRADPVLSPGDRVLFVLEQPLGKVFVFGAVNRPGEVPLTEGLYLNAAIEKAGGYSERALKTHVTLERAGIEPIVYDLTLQPGNVPLVPGDKIIVGISDSLRFVNVTGEVAGAGFVEYRLGMTILDAIQTAGGLEPDAKITEVRLLRKGEPEREIDLKAIADGKAPNIELKPGDTIDVPGRSRGITSKQILIGVGILIILFGL